MVPARLDRIDLVRALAMLWMAAFHFSFDLNQARLIPPQNFYADPFWTLQRLCIVALFVGLAGLGQGLSGGMAPPTAPQRAARAFWRRWGQIVACALLVSASSWWMFPRSFIFFGVLHGMALSLLLARGGAALMARWHWSGARRRQVWGALAVAMLTLPQLLTHALFDSRWTTWVGLGTRKPVTEDFTPLMPWFGVFLIGMLAGEALRTARLNGADEPPAWLAAVTGKMPAWLSGLAVLGRWPLSFYMLHQPILIGGLQLWLWVRA